MRPADAQHLRFLEATYRDVLGRPMDPAGGAHYLQRMREGATGADVISDLKASDEYRMRVEQSTISLPDVSRDRTRPLRRPRRRRRSHGPHVHRRGPHRLRLDRTGDPRERFL